MAVLSIPQELRDQIYGELVRTGDIEQCHASGALRLAMVITNDHKERIASSRHLAATCKQIRDETEHYRSFTASKDPPSPRHATSDNGSCDG